MKNYKQEKLVDARSRGLGLAPRTRIENHLCFFLNLETHKGCFLFYRLFAIVLWTMALLLASLFLPLAFCYCGRTANLWDAGHIALHYVSALVFLLQCWSLTVCLTLCLPCFVLASC